MAIWACATAVADPQERSLDAQQSAANSVETLFSKMGIVNGVVAPIDLAEGEVVPSTVEVPLDGHIVTLLLTPHSVRSNKYQLLVQGEDGALREQTPGPVTTFRGDVLEMPGSIVAGGMVDGGLYAHISLPDGAGYYVEPVRGIVPGYSAADHVIYHAGDSFCGGSCGLDTPISMSDVDTVADGHHGAPMAAVNICVAEIAIDADTEFFNDWGSVSAVEARVNTVINTMNLQYENEVAISHSITTIIVRTAEPDPYTTSDPGNLLNQFGNEWFNNHPGVPRDVAELFTGKDMDGNVIGIAWLSGVCGGFGYNVVQSDFTSNFSCTTDLSAHELGHNWGASHCTCPSNTMNPSITCSNTFHPTATIPTIVSFRNAASCLDCGAIGGDVATNNDIIVKVGTQTGGTLADVDDSDNSYVTFNSETVEGKERIKVIFEIVSPHANASQLNLVIETGADVPVAYARVHLRDYDTQTWVLLDSYEQGETDTDKLFFNVPNPDRFIRNGNNHIRARLFMRTGGNAFEARVDHVEATVQP